jgi:hypothetical protein
LVTVAVPQVLYQILQTSGRSGLLSLPWWAAATLGFSLLAGLASLLAAAKLTRGVHGNRRALGAAAVLNLALPPLGPLVGAWALWTLRKTGPGPEPQNAPAEDPLGAWAAAWLPYVAALALWPLCRVYWETPIPWWPWPFVAVLGYPIGAAGRFVGHVAAALASEMRVRRVTIGPLVWTRLAAGWQFGYATTHQALGRAFELAPLSIRRLRSRLVFSLAGGPVVSLLLGTSFALGGLARPVWVPEVVAPWLFLTGLIEMLKAAVDLLPLRKGNGPTPALRMAQLLSGSAEGSRFLAETAFSLSEFTSLRPRDWPREWVDAMTGDASAREYIAGCFYAYLHYLDGDDRTKAAEWMERLLECLSHQPRHPQSLRYAAEGAYYHAFHRKNLITAWHWMSQEAPPAAVDPFVFERAKAAVSLLEKEPANAKRMLETALRALAAAAQTGYHLMEKKLLQELQDSAEPPASPADSLTRLQQAVEKWNETAAELAQAGQQRLWPGAADAAPNSAADSPAAVR